MRVRRRFGAWLEAVWALHGSLAYALAVLALLTNDTFAWALLGELLLLFLALRTFDTAWRFGPAGLAWVMSVEGLLLCAIIAGATALETLGSTPLTMVAATLLGWKFWFFYVAARWIPARGLFRLPKWPRTPLVRGRGRRGARRFREPMPWTAGPFSRG